MACSRPKASGLGGRPQRHQRDLRSGDKRTEPEARFGLSGGRWCLEEGSQSRGKEADPPHRCQTARLRGCACSGV